MTLPIPAGALNQHVIVLGKTRSGKSSKMRLMVEGLLDDGKPVCVIDPKGDWWGLKSSADGKRAGYPVIIFGGERADVPINEHSGAHIAELIATGNRPCIIDLGGWMVGARTRFFVDFAATLFKLTRGPRWLVIDECHNFAPQGRVLDPDAGKMLHWANRLASEGSGKGLTLISASQRPQKVHKDYVTSHETLIATRVIHPLDRGAIKDWIDGCADPQIGKDIITAIAGLNRSQAYVWSPEIGFGPELVTFPMFKTYDSFKAQDHDAPTALKGWATVDLDEVTAKLSRVVEEAKANDPKALKAEIAKLKVDLTKATDIRNRSAPPDAKVLEIADQEGYRRGWNEGIDAGLIEGERRGNIAGQALALTRVRNALDALRVVQSPADAMPAAKPAPALVQRRAEPAPAASAAQPSPAPAPRQSEGDTVLTGPQRRIIDAIAWWAAGGIPAPSNEQVAFIAGYSSATSGGYANPRSALSAAGLIRYPRPNCVELTEDGAVKAAAPATAVSAEALHARVFEKMSGPQARILRPLIDAYPESIGNAELAEQAGYSSPTSGGFANPRSSLSSLSLITYPAPGQVRAADWLFP